ncbi:hypothetical protein GGH94_006231 [Coemansia aciculifera]|uniref:P-loop containing nucleoside triphosphate hydrolase protein n=1 Tax=Coemansia aciculifera TaxID=417176 RepID=A0A9W8ICA2_9FUNG|nr:hypothetical protein GGH94_006231 [Coemansia aciculifera]
MTTLAPEHVPLLPSLHGPASNVDPSWRIALRRILRPMLALASGTALFSAFQAIREFSPNDRHGHQCAQLTDDCFRLGVAWPVVNVILGIGALVSLLLLPTSPSHDDNSNNRLQNKAAPELGGVKVSFRDNRQRMAAAAVGVSLVGAAVPLAFLQVSASAIQGNVPSVHKYHQVYWQSHMAFWISALLALTHGLLARSYSGATSSRPAFHWLLILAVALQLLLSALVEGYFNFFTGSHIYEPVWFSLHSRFVLASAVISAVATLVQLATHRRGFYQLDAQLNSAERKQVAAALGKGDDNDDYTTPLTRMRAEKAPLVTSPEHRSSLLDKLSFGWIAPLMDLGSKVQLESGDLCRLDARDRPLSNWRLLARHYKPGNSLILALARTFWRQMLVQNALSLLRTVLGFGGAFFMQRILRSIRLYNSGGGGASALLSASTARLIYLDAIGLMFHALVMSLISQQDNWLSSRLRMRIRGVLTAFMVSRALGRRGRGAPPPSSEKSADDADDDTTADDAAADESKDGSVMSNGSVISILTRDISVVAGLYSSLDMFYSIPVSFGIGLWYLYNLVGVSAFVGLSLSIAYYPLSRFIYNLTEKYWTEFYNAESERITLITELFQGIRAVKLFGWQSRFVEKVGSKRQEQLDLTWRLTLLELPIDIAQSLISSLLLVAVLASYSLIFGHTLTADVLYPAMSIFYVVTGSINRVMSMYGWYARVAVSLRRVEAFMTRAMVQPLHERIDIEDSEGATCDAIGFSDASFEWSIKPTTSAADTPSKPLILVTDAAQAVVEELSERTQLLPSSSAVSIDSRVTTTARNSIMPSFALRDISLRFPIGGLSIIIGPTGSGKSSLLSALIGEMSLIAGKVIMPTADSSALDAELAGGRYSEIIELSGQSRVMRDIAYVSQEAWLRNATIRENILFGEAYDQQRYEEVLRVCALKPDMRLFDAGDRTEIGERGVTLSGGQKQRVALARAVYSSRRILVIDDCLSAVDAHTAKHILMECLMGQTPLMAGRTRVLVTHHVSGCMPHADYMAVMHEGRVTACGTPSAVQSQGGMSCEIQELDLELNRKQQPDQVVCEMDDKAEIDAAMQASVNDQRSEDDYMAEHLAKLAEERGVDPATIDPAELEDMLVEDEERKYGYVRPAIWIDFMRMCGSVWFWALLVGAIFVSNSASIFRNYWVRLWMASADGSGSSSHSVAFWLTTYTLSGMLSMIIGQASYIVKKTGTLRAARLYHERLFSRVINATPRFFDKTPIGRVINRFSGDLSVIDYSALYEITGMAGDVVAVASMVVIVSSVVPPFAIIALLLAYACARLSIYYMGATRELKRLGSVSRSPMFSLVSEIVTGVESIRAFGAQSQYIIEIMNRTDLFYQPDYLLGAARLWLEVRTSLSSSIVSFSTTILLLMNLDRIDAGLAGFILLYTTSFSSTILYFVHRYSSCESDMSSVERINQYLELEQEAPAFSDPANTPPSTWPSNGNVEVQDLVIEYVPGKPVVHGISFTAAHGEKIGVVGRTGAGKSTLSLAFLRFIEAAQGRILLDNVDISKLGLEELRRNVTIIPQDPVLFNGTIRFNLDPFSEYPDELLWDALKRSHLVKDSSDVSASSSGTASPAEEPVEAPANGTNIAGRMSGIFKSLDAEIKENGQNLSLGQRQLVAMARALVRRSRLIIMDEATASVDFDTDDRIQRTIRGAEFSDSTLFCIAHRLRTVIDYDRVLVMDRGRIVEFDTPWNLLQIKNGVFKSMCEKTGEYKHLVAMARSKGDKKVAA